MIAIPFARIMIASVLVALAGCGRDQVPPPVAAIQPVTEEPLPSVDGGDFRGYRWGDSVGVVMHNERARSTEVSAGFMYETQIAGYPATLSFRYDESDRLRSGTYAFPWPGAEAACRGVMTAGSECSLKSAKYAIEACGRAGRLLSEKLGELGAADHYAQTPAPSVRDLDRQLLGPDTGMDLAYRHWSSPRVLVAQFFMRDRGPGQAWRCRFAYYSSEALAVQTGVAKGAP